MSDVRRIMGVRPVESSSSTLVSGPGSEKRTRFLDFVFRLGVAVEAEDDSLRTVSFRQTTGCCDPTLLRVRRSERGSCDSSDILIASKIQTKYSREADPKIREVQPFLSWAQLQRDSRRKQSPGTVAFPTKIPLQCLFVSALRKWGPHLDATSLAVH
jgi:hypothetical protein